MNAVAFARTALLALTAAVATAAAQQPPDNVARIAAQKEAMAALDALDGQWRGTATIDLPNGAKMTTTHTERIGPLLDGTVKLIEGRSYDKDGATAFNAFAVVSYDPDTKRYSMRSYAQGHAVDVPFEATADGFAWSMPAGPMRMHYVATVKHGVWRETGVRTRPGQLPVPFIEMELKRIGDSDWPQAGAVDTK